MTTLVSKAPQIWVFGSGQRVTVWAEARGDQGPSISKGRRIATARQYFENRTEPIRVVRVCWCADSECGCTRADVMFRFAVKSVFIVSLSWRFEPLLKGNVRAGVEMRKRVTKKHLGWQSVRTFAREGCFCHVHDIERLWSNGTALLPEGPKKSRCAVVSAYA